MDRTAQQYLKSSKVRGNIAFAELMARYDEYRARWIEARGTDEGFDGWFTHQVARKGGDA